MLYVVKRDGRKAKFDINKIFDAISGAANDEGVNFQSVQISETVNKVVNYIKTTEKQEITVEEIQNEFPGQVLGRPHFAAWLEAHHYVKNRQAAFDKFLARGRPWYVERTGADLDESIKAIYESGGVPVLAHPMSLYLSWTKLEPALEDFYRRGIRGMECFHPGARVTECLRLQELARKLGFFVTAGSDFHGEKIRTDRKPGHTCGKKTIEDKYYFEELKPFLDNLERNKM